MAAGGGVARLQDVLNQRRAVDGDRQRLAHERIGKVLGLRVEHPVGVAELRDAVEVVAPAQRRDAGGGHAGQAVELARLIGVQRGGQVLEDHEVDAVELHLVSQPVVLVLHEVDALAHAIALQRERAVGDVVVVVGRPARVRGDDGLADRHVRPGRQQRGEVAARGSQRHLERQVVDDLDAHVLPGTFLVVIGLRVGDVVVDHVRARCAELRRDDALPGIGEVASGHVHAVGPLHALVEVERPDEAVIADVPARRRAGDELAVRVVADKADEAVVKDGARKGVERVARIKAVRIVGHGVAEDLLRLRKGRQRQGQRRKQRQNQQSRHSLFHVVPPVMFA